ncbi:pkgB, partial [Symbiodinium natans]
MSASAQAALRLRRLLAKQTQDVKEMEVELQERETEREHLLQLLRYKEQILQQESFAAERLRAALCSAKGCKQYYILLCVLRSWRDAALRSSSRRGLTQAKEQSIEVVLRHACGALAMGLRQVTNRRMANAMYELWLHAEGQRLAVAAEEADARLPPTWEPDIANLNADEVSASREGEAEELSELGE